jgi:hypothetical protein
VVRLISPLILFLEHGPLQRIDLGLLFDSALELRRGRLFQPPKALVISLREFQQALILDPRHVDASFWRDTASLPLRSLLYHLGHLRIA